jgi:hypothetical protein
MIQSAESMEVFSTVQCLPIWQLHYGDLREGSIKYTARLSTAASASPGNKCFSI